MEHEAHEPGLVRKLKARRAHHKRRHPVYRGAFVVLGIVLTLGGIAMLALPGPAFVVIPIGLAMLSLEFTWAERLLDRSLRQAVIARHKAAQTTPAQRVLTGVAVAAVAAGLVAWAVLGDVPVLPV